MQWLFIALLLVITLLAWLQLDSLRRNQAMHVSLLEITVANSVKMGAEPPEAIKRLQEIALNTNNVVGEIDQLRRAICGSFTQRGLGGRHHPGELERGFDKVVKALGNVEHAISLIEPR
jgi:hypothetical protein